jgi:hypothetical protein
LNNFSESVNFDTNKDAPWNLNRTELWNLHCSFDDESLDNPSYKTAMCDDYISDKTLNKQMVEAKSIIIMMCIVYMNGQKQKLRCQLRMQQKINDQLLSVDQQYGMDTI